MSPTRRCALAALLASCTACFLLPANDRQCASDDDCTGDDTCLVGRCVECLDDGDCDDGAACDDGACVDGATSSSNCDAADILIVVDNSGSMLEEQQQLVDALFDVSGDCPLADLVNIPEQFRDPGPELVDGAGPLASCGMLQLLAAHGNDFRVGVITTDVGLCDNKFPAAQAAACVNGSCLLSGEFCDGFEPCVNDWGFRPQRGCLQGDAPPELVGARKVIAAADLVDGDGGNDDFGARIAAVLDNIRTFGSPYERGLDAVATFLDEDAERGPGCAGDLALFRRPEAQLVVIFVTDEDDCSHSLGDGDATWGNELAGEVCGEFLDLFTQDDPARCYAEAGLLPPVTLYANAVRAVDDAAKIVVVGGSVGGAGATGAAGCTVGGDGDALAGCFGSQGQSNFIQPGQICSASPDPNDPRTAERAGRPCCTGDAATRYHAFAALFGGNARTDSICTASLRRPLQQAALDAVCR